MVLVGGRVEKLEAKLMESKPIAEMRMDLAIGDVELDRKTLKIPYTAKTHYGPGVAEITVAGVLFWEEENEKKAKDFFDNYKKEGRLPNAVAEEAVTAITYTNGAVGTLGAFALGITAPINTPRARIAPGTQQGNSQAS